MSSSDAAGQAEPYVYLDGFPLPELTGAEPVPGTAATVCVGDHRFPYTVIAVSGRRALTLVLRGDGYRRTDIASPAGSQAYDYSVDRGGQIEIARRGPDGSYRTVPSSSLLAGGDALAARGGYTVQLGVRRAYAAHTAPPTT
ncbi:hypothetical protein EPN42_04530 [bacterium]|nr:MAG: hypothetical protein EPN42_04530 [bacterium]